MRFKKGHNPWNKGKKWIEMSGENHPMWGKQHSEKSKKQISQTKMGSIPWNKGIKGIMKAWNKGKSWSEESRKKMSEAKKGKSTSRKGKKAPWASGEKNVNFGRFGKDHPRYKEHKRNPFLRQIRQLFKYRQWRSDIFTRDNFTCLFCGEKRIELNADHYPKRFIDIINEYEIDTLEKALLCEELWDINNGRTLCVNCHRKTDTWGNTRSYKISSD